MVINQWLKNKKEVVIDQIIEVQEGEGSEGGQEVQEMEGVVVSGEALQGGGEEEEGEADSEGRKK